MTGEQRDTAFARFKYWSITALAVLSLHQPVTTFIYACVNYYYATTGKYYTNHKFSLFKDYMIEYWQWNVPPRATYNGVKEGFTTDIIMINVAALGVLILAIPIVYWGVIR